MSVFKHEIKDGNKPVASRPYRTPLTHRPIMSQLIKEMLKHKIIQPSVSSYSSPIMLVNQKGGQLRLVVDFRSLNKQTQRDLYPMKNSPSVFQRSLEIILKNAKAHSTNYLDDIVIWSKDFDSHMKHLRHVFELLRKSGLKLKPEKYTWGVYELHYLGHIVSRQGIKTDPRKIKAMVNYPAPTNIRQLRTWNGLSQYYRRFIRDYAKIAALSY